MRRVLHIAGLGLALALVSAACGGSTSDTSSVGAAGGNAASAEGASYAKEQLAKYAEAATWTAPGPAVDGSKAAGKTAMYIGATFASSTIASIADGLKEGLAQVNAKTQFCDAKGTPDGWTTCMTSGINQGVDAIVADSFPLTQVEPLLQRAKAAGIPVIAANSEGLTGPLFTNTSARVAMDYERAGRLLADYVISESNGKGKALVLTTGDLPAAGVMMEGANAEFKEHCPSCTVTVKSTPLAAWPTQLGQTTQSALASDPKLGYVIPLFDDMMPYAGTAISSVANSRKLKVATFNADLHAMKDLADGRLVNLQVGTDNSYNGWAQADQIIRLWAGAEPVAEEHVPLRVFSRDSVKDLELSEAAVADGRWYMDPEKFKDGFRSLWTKK